MLCFLRTYCCNVDSWLTADDDTCTLFLPCTFAMVTEHLLNRIATNLTSDATFLEYKTDMTTTAIFAFSVPHWDTLNTTMAVIRGNFWDTLNTTMTAWTTMSVLVVH